MRIDITPKQVTVEKIEQHVAMVDNSAKPDALHHLLMQKDVTRAIVFGRTKHGCEKIARKLRSAGVSAEAIHGNKSQNARNRALDAFKTGEAWVLVATDIAARGIDIDGVSHVINYELPHEPESYVHRIGRTGRAGAQGCAWSFVDPSEQKRLKSIERFIKLPLKVTQLDVPADSASPPPRQLEVKSDSQRQTESNPTKQRRPRRRRARRAAA